MNGYEQVREVGKIGKRYDSEPLSERLMRLHDVPEDVCPRREAISGAIIVWIVIFAAIWAAVGLAVWGL